MYNNKTHKDKIKILKNAKNVGAGASRNKGLKIASGEYITFIDKELEEQLYFL